MLRQFLEIAAHFFVVYFDVAALLILVLLNKSWIAACGPFYSLKTWLLMKRTLWEWTRPQNNVTSYISGWLVYRVIFFFFYFFFVTYLVWNANCLGGFVCLCVFGQFLVFLWQKKPYWNPRHESENGWLMFDDVLIWYWLKAYCPALQSFP